MSLRSWEDEYRALWKRAEQALGHLRMDKLKPLHFQELYNNLQEDGMNKRTGGKLSDSTIHHYHVLLSSMMNTAVLWGILPVTPLKVKPPKVQQKEAVNLNEVQAAALLNALDGEPIQYKTMVYILLYTGIRKGEMLGIEWKDIDFNSSLLAVKRSSQYIPKQGIITKEPKNKSSQRVIKLSQRLMDILLVYKVWQTEERLKIGELWNSNDRLFTSWNGVPMHPDTLPKWFDKFLKRHSLPDANIHALRHTCALVHDCCSCRC